MKLAAQNAVSSVRQPQWKRFLRFGAASLSSALVDLLLFSLFAALVFEETSTGIFLAGTAARLLSGVYNFLVNRGLVFRQRGEPGRQAAGYAILFCAQMFLSASLVSLLSFSPVPLTAGKLLVDGGLFLLSFQVQRKMIFRDSSNQE